MAGAQQGQTVMLVDDEDDILASLRVFLEGELVGVRVLTARSGPEALQMLERDDVDLIIADYRMPGMDGLQLLAEVRRKKPHITAMMMTAYPDPTLASRAAKECGVGLFLAKPFDLNYFVRVVEACLKKSPGP